MITDDYWLQLQCVVFVDTGQLGYATTEVATPTWLMPASAPHYGFSWYLYIDVGASDHSSAGLSLVGSLAITLYIVIWCDYSAIFLLFGTCIMYTIWKMPLDILIKSSWSVPAHSDSTRQNPHFQIGVYFRWTHGTTSEEMPQQHCVVRSSSSKNPRAMLQKSLQYPRLTTRVHTNYNNPYELQQPIRITIQVYVLQTPMCITVWTKNKSRQG